MAILSRSVAALGLMLLSACSVIPAKLERTHALGQPTCPFEQQSLHALLELALEKPNEGESAHALAHVVEEWREERGDETAGMVEPAEDSATDARFRVRFRSGAPAVFLPSYFDEVSPAVDYRVKKIEHFQKEGFGAPLRAVRENTGREPVERHYPPEVIAREITAVVHPGRTRGGIREVEIELKCALYYEDCVVGGKRLPLAADYSVALASLLERARKLARRETADLFTSSPERDPKLYLMEPYDPRKEPLIMIHGLLDSPLAWAELTNELRSDPEIRRRYQIWHFLYNTSAPALYSGRLLRGQYREMRKEFDPGLDDPASRRSTLVTHSMGGIVARGLITDPGEAFWEAGFTRPLGSLVLSEDDRAMLRDAFLWEPEPSIRRVVFVCVPHRGSEYADNVVGRIGRGLVKPPNRFREFYQRISEANPGAFTEGYRELGEGKLDSVGALSPRQPTLQILPELPIGNHVSVHSIIATRGKEGPLQDSHDGVVAYWSSHLPDADSETIVPHGHACLDEFETIQEIKRLLKSP